MASKSNTKTLLIVALTLGAVYFLRGLGNSLYNALKFGSVQIRFKGITANFGILLDVIIPITNTNPKTITITDFNGRILYGNTQIATIDQRNPVPLVAGSTSNYTIEAAIDVRQLSEDVKQQIQSRNFLQSFFLKGQMQVGAIKIPINEQITVLF